MTCLWFRESKDSVDRYFTYFSSFLDDVIVLRGREKNSLRNKHGHLKA